MPIWPVPLWPIVLAPFPASETSTGLPLPLITVGSIALLSAAIIIWWRTHRDPAATVLQGLLPPSLDLPADSPTQAARLLSYDTSTGLLLLAMLVDLAGRGVLTMAETLEGRHTPRRRIVLTRLPSAAALTPLEREVLDLVFATSQQVDLAKQRQGLVDAHSWLGAQLDAELAAKGYLRSAKRPPRSSGIAAGVVFLVGGIFASCATGEALDRYRDGWWLVVLSLLVALLGLIWLGLAIDVRNTTAAGTAARLQLQSFQQGLRKLSPRNAPAGRFAALLPYAVALNEHQRLCNAYRTSAEPLPVWYTAPSSSIDQDRAIQLKAFKDSLVLSSAYTSSASDD